MGLGSRQDARTLDGRERGTEGHAEEPGSFWDALAGRSPPLPCCHQVWVLPRGQYPGGPQAWSWGQRSLWGSHMHAPAVTEHRAVETGSGADGQVSR